MNKNMIRKIFLLLSFFSFFLAESQNDSNTVVDNSVST